MKLQTIVFSQSQYSLYATYREKVKVSEHPLSIIVSLGIMEIRSTALNRRNYVPAGKRPLEATLQTCATVADVGGIGKLARKLTPTVTQKVSVGVFVQYGFEGQNRPCYWGGCRHRASVLRRAPQTWSKGKKTVSLIITTIN